MDWNGSSLLRGSLMTTFVLIVFLSALWISDAQITRPPKYVNRPIHANGRIYYLEHIPKHCIEPFIDKFPSGKVIKDNRALIKKDNPHIIRGNIEIAKTGCLYIEPGAVLKFGAGFGMIINGTLIARGSEENNDRITMTKADGEDTGAPSGDWQDDARLSMGNTTRDGRLDLLYKGKWRAICTNYNNFTKIDANVTCRHLGFLKGNFTYHSYSRNLTEYILWEKPACRGSENNLFDCPGVNSIKTGQHICDGQEVVGFSCEGLRPGLALDHWRGLDFYNSTTVKKFQIQDSFAVYMNEAESFLEYLDISYAGLDTFHGKTSEPDINYQKAAISASPHVPKMNNVTIRYGAYDALNLTEIEGPIIIANSTISHNRGYGMFIQSSVGRTLVNMTEVTDNWGDGIKFYLSNLTIYDFRRKFPAENNMCNQGNVRGQVFPFYQHLDMVEVTENGRKKAIFTRYCDRTFETQDDMKIGVHFMIMERDPEASGELVFYDGSSSRRLLARVPIDNGSFPQSLTSKTNIVSVRFEPKIPAGGICKSFPPCLRFLMEFTAGPDVEEEFRLLMSTVTNNIGYGVNIQDMRSKVRISNETLISGNQFGAGIRVYRGAGEIIINGTVVEGNADSGINITYSGGFQLLNNTKVISNKGYGMITEYLKLNRTRFEHENRIQVVRSTFNLNKLVGLRMGNYCKGGEIKINESYFSFNYDDAFEYLSCNISTPEIRKLFLDLNEFESNFRHAIIMRPLLNTEGLISNNSFINHSLAGVAVDNGFDLLINRWYRDFPVALDFFENRFTHNRGRYAISLRLSHNSAVQKINCKFNYFENNEINNSFPYLNPRSRANAVVVLSSSNVKFSRNIMNNPLSIREIATHLTDPTARIDATENYWGYEILTTQHFEHVYKNIFDQDDRFNLALVSYEPALKTSRFYEDYLTSNVSPYEWRFDRPNNVIGGVLEARSFTANAGQTYYVDRDIFIHPNLILTLPQGTTLKFQPSIGMVVHGYLNANSQRRESPVIFDIDDSEPLIPMENRTAPVRLVAGGNEYEGRLEVEIDGEWGTVCSEGWIVENALLACQQMGLVFDRERPLPGYKSAAPGGTPILMSWVSCTEVDDDLTKCRAIFKDVGQCSHEQDVYLRCQTPTWAGITIAASDFEEQKPGQRETKLNHVKILNAGLLDPDTASLMPALRIDYNFYQFSWLTIHNSVSDAIQVGYNHPYHINKLEFLDIRYNGGNGIVTRSPRLSVNHSKIIENEKAGYVYDPFFTEYEALLIRNMIFPNRQVNMFETDVRVIEKDKMMFLLCPIGNKIEKKDYYVQVQSRSRSQRLTVQILDYLPVESAEKLTIYESSLSGINTPNVRKWKIADDLVDFPLLVESSIITIKLTVDGLMSGRLAIVVISGDYSSPPYLYTEMTNMTISDNDQGIVTRHYNNPSNKRLELFMRHKLEEIYFKDIRTLNNKRHAIHMPSVTKFDEEYVPTYEDMTRPERSALIIYTLFKFQVENNGYGILAEHNHVDFANNAWQWRIKNVAFVRNKRGGLEIEVPRVNDENQQSLHAVSVTDCQFTDNENFALTIAGYYAAVTIDRNEFTNNDCILGLISLSGMEKNLSCIGNVMRENKGKYVLDMDILSHAEHSGEVTGLMGYNSVIDNKYVGPTLPGAPYSPKTYTISIRGLQKIIINRNIFTNRDMDYELVAGVTALTLDNEMDVRENYWGTDLETDIRKRIFDFDDWNNYAIAEYYPYLQQAIINSQPATGGKGVNLLDPNRLGGRVERSETLPETGKPFIIESDWTIMPGVTLKIPPGTDLQFRPNVGILVLGTLDARGLPYRRIKMRPVQPTSSEVQSVNNPGGILGRRKRQAEMGDLRLRGDGDLFKNAGFLEIYNSSTKSYNLMCDSQFNEKTAEVVCRELGKETVNVKVRFTHLYDYHIFGRPMYSLKQFWYNSYLCRGDESNLDQCNKRYNYNLQSCVYAANYTFITCGERNLEPEQDYWGNIRFASDSFEEKPLEADIGKDQSSMTYVDIEGAGILHGQQVGAVQTTYATPNMQYINISKCAGNGYDIVAPRQSMMLAYQNISSNLGYGINVLVLNGESRDDKSSFSPNGPSTIPYSVYGFVDICSLEKELTLKTRLILFYKYGPHNRDCVKVIQAFSSSKRVGLRFLQLNLFHEDFSRNVIEIFDGKTVHNIVANTSTEDVLHRFDSVGDTLKVHIHASLGHEIYGFVAEVVKVPVSGLTYADSTYSHHFKQMEIRQNEDGAIRYKNVGETNPSVYIENCFITHNGFPILNLTSPPTIDIALQSTIGFRFSHNQVTYNKGGMYLYAYTSSSNMALSGNITNNIFAFGSHGEALNISGHYFQRLMLHQNYVYNYTSGDFRDIIHVKDVVVNLTHNYVLRNLGHYILHTFNSDDASQSQLFARNGIYDNNSTALVQSTIKIGKGHPNFTKNFLVNALNDFEMETFPKKGMSNVDTPIPATSNWWGSERRVFINGKIYDSFDDSTYLPVDFWTPILDNRSLVQGNCLPGWVMDKGQCYRYMGGALPFEDAKRFCRSHGAFLAESKGQLGFFNYLLRLMVIDLNWSQRVWVMSDVGSNRCSAFEIEYIVFEEDCDRRYYPFICETDPYLQRDSELAMSNMIIGISAGVGSLFIILVGVVIILWCLKSKRREKERFERTASMRSSINNLNKINGSLRGTKSTLTMLSEGQSRRRLNELDERSLNSFAKQSQSSAGTNGVNGSTYSINSGYDVNPEPVSTGRRENMNSRPVHSLRPDRSGRGGRNARETEEQERRDRDMRDREKERERRRREEEEDERSRRQRHAKKEEEYVEESDGDSVNKRGLDDSDFSDDDDSYDSEFDEDEENNNRGDDDATASNIHYNLHRSHEKLMEKPADELDYRGPRSRENVSYKHGLPPIPTKPKPFSSFAAPENDRSYPEKRPLERPAFSQSREELPTPPPDPRNLAPSSDVLPNPSSKPVPKPKPKPQPPVRRDAPYAGLPVQGLQEENPRQPSPAPRKNMGSQEMLYNNEPGPRYPVYDPVYDGRRMPDDTRGRDRSYDQGSRTGPLYDPVYDGSSLNQSQSTNRYEPMDLAPDTDYLPRNLGNPAVSQSRDRLGPPPVAPSLPTSVPHQRKRLESDIDSYAPSIQSDVDYMPRRFQPNNNRNNFADSLPPKPGMDPVHKGPPSHHGSRDYLNTAMPQPPPYSEERDLRSSRDRLDRPDRPYRGSREQLDDQPPPYSPGKDLRLEQRAGSHNVLYLNQGARPKTQESFETEI